MTNPRVSVVMPVYNGERYLREAVESILGQTFTDFEFIVVDDGSTDDSATIVRSYQDPRLRFVQNAQNLGISATLNSGLQLVQGDLVARMDADDVSHPLRLAQQVAFLEGHSDVGVLGTTCQYIDESGKPGLVWSPPTQHGVLCWLMCFHCPLPHPSVMIRKEMLFKLGGYTEGRYAEDYDLWRRVSSFTRLATLQNVLLQLRRHASSITESQQVDYQLQVVRISQSVMSDLLQRTLLIQLVEQVVSKRLGSAEEAYQCALAVRDLYTAYIERHSLSKAEQTRIAADASARIFHWAYHLYGLQDRRYLPVLTWAWQIEPTLVAGTILKFAGRKFRRLSDSYLRRS